MEMVESTTSQWRRGQVLSLAPNAFFPLASGLMNPIGRLGGSGGVMSSRSASKTRNKGDATCCVPCDHVPIRSWPLFKARDVMRGVIESFKEEKTQ